MRIGIDFDNTIACYDGVFHSAALERGLIPASVEKSKSAVRDYLNSNGGKDAFTELQGYIYGARMDLAAPYSGVRKFIKQAAKSKYEMFVVSHKTARPILGPAYDMHAAARSFLERHGLVGEGRIPKECVFLEQTKDAKLAKISELGLDVFIDDLPEIFNSPCFPSQTRAFLFDPDGRHVALTCADSSTRPIVDRHADWPSIQMALLPVYA